MRVLLAPQGGVDIETLSTQPGIVRSMICDPDPAAVAAGVRSLCKDLAEPLRGALTTAGAALARPFFAYECTLLEINPLFVKPDGRGSPATPR